MSTPTSSWPAPSPRIAELIREGCALMLATPEDVAVEVDAVTLADTDPAVLADPSIVEAIRRANRANLLHWAEANVRDPGAPVAPNLGPEVVNVARDMVRRGIDAVTLDAYRTGQNAAWRLWMALAFRLSTDPDELSELLDITARSIFSFVDATIAGITAQVLRERERLTRGTHAERLEVVTLILEGAPIAQARASTRLQYALDRDHTAAVVFSDSADPDQGVLGRAAEALAQAAGARAPFSVTASASSLWVWIPGAAGPDLERVRAAMEDLPGTRIALGTTDHGLAGFRRSHLDALTTQRLLHRTPDHVRLASYAEVQVVALATQDEERAREFAERTLGDLADAPSDLRETVRTYVREGFSASRTAEQLFTHRNTILNRLGRAEDLMPAPLTGRTVQVGVALEVVRWLGTR
ncbi:MAG: PucR family transcriptional regulator [Patulibacter sp.]|nr:PucR family transcriptional regulator [Patulibacter sp.]MDO9409957.1 PucR family transcriptional regulator [Patulibacter sp.]